MRPLLVVLVFFLIYRGPLQAQPLHDLLALIEQHNPELQEQRCLLDTTAADAADGAEVLHLLQRQDRSFWRYFALSGRAGGKATPGDEGTGGDVRLSLDFVLPLGDLSDKLAVAKERQRQQREQREVRQQVAQQRLAYERQQAALRTGVVEALAAIEATQTKLAAAQGTLARHRERQALTVRRVQEGVDSRRESWKLDDQVGKLAEEAALLASALGQQRMALALLAGEQWQAALALLQRQRTWFGGEEAGEQMVRGD